MKKQLKNDDLYKFVYEMANKVKSIKLRQKKPH